MATVKRISEERTLELKKLAKLLAVEGVRNNTELEDLHAGITPRSETGDFSDVKIVSPFEEIEWNRISRISDKEMRSLMLSIERAIEKALMAYEMFGDAEREMLMEYAMMQCTYDHPDSPAL